MIVGGAGLHVLRTPETSCPTLESVAREVSRWWIVDQFSESQEAKKHSISLCFVKLSASFRYLSGSEPYGGFGNMQSLLGQTVCYG